MLHIQLICLFLHNKTYVESQTKTMFQKTIIDVLIGYYNDDEDEEDGGYNDDGVDWSFDFDID